MSDRNEYISKFSVSNTPIKDPGQVAEPKVEHLCSNPTPLKKAVRARRGDNLPREGDVNPSNPSNQTKYEQQHNPQVTWTMQSRLALV